MKVEDFIYGEEEIDEEILIELINSKEIQRLKGISQMGLPDRYYHKKIYSRYAHSLGVLTLLRMMNADIKEQIAGLIHDVSHTAFSHVIDWVVGDCTKEDYQDKIFSDFIKNSEIPNILEKYNFNYRDFLELEQYPLLEQSAPSLCVDRFDYAIREIKEFESSENIFFMINHLKSFNGKLCFDSIKAAEIFAYGYTKLQNEHWAGNEAKARYHILANILKKALNKKIISSDDFKKTDEEVAVLLENSKEKEILDGLTLLKDGFQITEDNKGVEIFKKFRHIDPEILINKEIKQLSKVSSKYKELLDNEKRNANLTRKINIIPIIK